MAARGWLRGMAVSALMLGAAAGAQEMSFRSGVVTGITPVQVAAAQSQQSPPSRGGGALGRALGRVAGRAASRVSGEYAYEAYDVASGTARDLVDVATVPGAAAGTVTAYLVTLRFDDGSESAIRSAEAGALRVGARARVFGSGASAQIVAE